MRVAGVDGCRVGGRGGWIAVLVDVDDHIGLTALTVHLTAPIIHIAELFDMEDAPAIVAVDMPIGLPERTGPKGRAPEREARPLLGGRQSSVFSIPSRSAVYAGIDPAIPEEERFRHACAIARATSEEMKAVSKQGFNIFPRIVEIDRLLRDRPELQPRLFECHPEVAFWAMNGRTSMPEPKKVKGAPYGPGLALRRKLLESKGFDGAAMSAARARSLKVGEDDLVDAFAAAWTAIRIARGQAISFPEQPERDALGLPMAIWA